MMWCDGETCFTIPDFSLGLWSPNEVSFILTGVVADGKIRNVFVRECSPTGHSTGWRCLGLVSHVQNANHSFQTPNQKLYPIPTCERWSLKRRRSRSHFTSGERGGTLFSDSERCQVRAICREAVKIFFHGTCEKSRPHWMMSTKTKTHQPKNIGSPISPIIYHGPTTLTLFSQ